MSEGYIKLTTDIILGTAGAIRLEETCNKNFSPYNLITNAPIPGFMILDHLHFNDKDELTVPIDGYEFSPRAMGGRLYLHKLTKHNVIRATGMYTGCVPPTRQKGESFTVQVTLMGTFWDD